MSKELPVRNMVPSLSQCVKKYVRVILNRCDLRTGDKSYKKKAKDYKDEIYREDVGFYLIAVINFEPSSPEQD